MGLWNKVIKRSLTGEPRLENYNRMFLSYKDRDINLSCYPEMLELATGEFITFQFDKYHDMLRTYKENPTLRFKISNMKDVEFIQNEFYNLNDIYLMWFNLCSDCVFHDMSNINEYIIEFKNLFIRHMYDNVIECTADWATLNFI